MVVSNIQEYVFKKHNMGYGNYSFIATEIENGFIHPSISTLTEYDIPLSAIKKLSPFINTDDPPEVNIVKLQRMKVSSLKKLGLIDYEIYKIIRSL